MLSPLFTGERVRLTALRPEDATLMANWYEDGEFSRLWDATTARPRSEMNIRKWFNDLDSAKEDFAFAIRLMYSDEMIGYVDISDTQWNNGTAWIAIAIGDPSNRGKGYGADAMALALKFAFHEINLHRVQLSVFSYNERAIRLYERLGFTREGTYREALLRDGRRYDTYLYGLLRRDWEAGFATT